MWEVEFTEEFERWFEPLTLEQQEAVAHGVDMIQLFGPKLGRPYVDTLKGSRHSNMKELRSQSGGRPLRTFFVFDRRRTAILLLGGDKTGDNRFYDRMIPLADNLYDAYLQDLRKDGLIP